MKEYKVSFMKIQSYEVEAENAMDAEDIALEILNEDEWAFLHEHVDEIKIEEIKKGKCAK